MPKNKSANRNPANYRLYHALMEALIEDENAMDKEVADKAPSAGSNRESQPKRRKTRLSASGSAQPHSKDSEQSTKNKLDSNASAAQQPPAHTSSAWQITDTRDTPPGPPMQRSNHQSEKSSDDNPITDEGHVSPITLIFLRYRLLPGSNRFLKKKDQLHLNQNRPFLQMITLNQRTTGKMYTPQRIKDLRRISFQGRRVYRLLHQWFLQRKEEEAHAKLIWKVDLVNPEGHQILRNVYEPFPLGGPPGQVTIQPQLFFNKDLEYLLAGNKERKTALSISKLKAARYLDFGLEELVLYLWVESERDYDISAAYGITHWWFRRKEFYINKHREPSDRDAVRSHMRILSVISIKTYERYGYNYLREIVLRRADYKEYKISEKDFKNLHPNDFEDLFLLHLQDKLNHLPKSDKVNLHIAVNMWIRNIIIRKRVEDLQLGVESY
ncbi:hypothetical protein Tco_0859460 [Tanacetum coccineum]|uniref:Uncharacterized protein n=1 Tax=Tanacetum coccineum TaxID=301880 RepID=A0ABQ5BF17_9ASTR